ncbi:hypothetical protein KDD30_16970 (plasmid) [Photobacterium sp. GJ3]|uniref:hypothetical protein n=1 Tax=Photobacterium sp. GJ3 TaxID=2829502 RepID=UPI001B8B4E63|nr:hypothetical protein [Photobacterium sp. GJ3]QUJ69864.1 hypothetical protein KDD30_16970 [Photobacterium sp. GJ3]
MRLLVVLLAGLLSMSANAVNMNYVGSGVSTIKILHSYSEYGGGDVYFTLTEPETTACPNGYWLRKTDPGFEANLSMAIAAYHAKSSIEAYGLSDEIWSGSNGKYCRLYAISYR